MAARWFVYRVNIDGKLAYVGKGCGRRWLVSARRLGGIAGILQFFTRESEAIRAEKRLIAELRPPYNKTAGGGGFTRRSRDADAAIETGWRSQIYANEISGNWLDRLVAICFRKCDGIQPTHDERLWVAGIAARSIT